MTDAPATDVPAKASWMTKIKDVVRQTYDKVADSFNNPSLNYGPQSNAIGNQTWSNERLSIQWQWLNMMYRTNTLHRRLVDVAAKDMTREPLIFMGTDDPSNLEKLQKEWTRLAIAKEMRFGMSMARLFGGAIAYLYIDGQDSSTPLDLDTIGKGQFLGVKIYHRWQLSASIEVDFFTEQPIYYDVTSGTSTYTTNSPDQEIIMRIHSSRCIKLSGDDLTYYDWIENLRWGASIFEQGYDRVLYMNTGVAAIAGILTKASLQIYKVNDLMSTLSTGDDGSKDTFLDKALLRMRQYRNTEGITVIDSLDEMEIHNYQLTGVDTCADQLRLEICSAFRYPVTKIYLDAPSGLTATGDNDTRMYYDEIKGEQEDKLRPGYSSLLVPVLYRSAIGKAPKEDFDFKFAPLWQMDAKEKSEIAVNDVNAVTMALGAGVISNKVALQELRQRATTTELFSNISDKDIENAEDSDPPAPGDNPGETTPDTGGPVKSQKEASELGDEEGDDGGANQTGGTEGEKTEKKNMKIEAEADNGSDA